MKRTKVCFAGAALGILFLASMPAFGQAHPDSNQGNAALPKTDSTKPGPAHGSLAKLAGDYGRVIKFVGPAGAGMAPFSGTAKISVVLGGRFLLEESTDEVMGSKVEGLRLYGYNNGAKQYEMVRMYTMSTAMTMMTGTSSDGGKTINFVGTTDNTAKGAAPLHAEFRMVSDDDFVVTFSTIGDDGKDAPFQSTEYTRKK
jgi:Protein of unknown function (DUF1579)